MIRSKTPRIAPQSRRAQSSLGSPASYILIMESSAATAYRIMMIDGGMSRPRVPAPHSEPRQVFSS